MSSEGYPLALPAMEQNWDDQAIAVLVQLHAGLLFRVAFSLLRSRADAEDVVQDSFLRVLERRHTLASIRDLRVWLVRITWNLALDRKRRIRPDQLDPLFAHSLVAPNLPADKALEEARRIQAVLLAMEKLPRREREVLLLCTLEELPTSEIARVLGRSESAVRALLARARTRLRQRVEREITRDA